MEGNSLYVIGERISPSAGEVEGEYTARFAVGAGDALTYQGITALTGAADDSQWRTIPSGGQPRLIPTAAGGG